MPKVALLPAELVVGPRAVAAAPVPTTLSVWAAPCVDHRCVRFSICEEQRAPHRDLARALVQIVARRPLVERAARRIVSVTHHLHISLELGASVRLRKAGTFRSSWYVDLIRSSATVCSWPVEARAVEQLDELDLVLDRHAARPGQLVGLAALGEYMREVASDVDREHKIDALIRQNLEMPTADLLRLLDDRGLLDPA